MPEPDFYIDEFMKELGTFVDPEGFSAKELARREGCSIRNANRIIEKEVDAGILEVAGFRKNVGSDGVVRRRTPVYRTKNKEKK